MLTFILRWNHRQLLSFQRLYHQQPLTFCKHCTHFHTLIHLSKKILINKVQVIVVIFMVLTWLVSWGSKHYQLLLTLCTLYESFTADHSWQWPCTFIYQYCVSRISPLKQRASSKRLLQSRKQIQLPTEMCIVLFWNVSFYLGNGEGTDVKYTTHKKLGILLFTWVLFLFGLKFNEISKSSLWYN